MRKSDFTLPTLDDLFSTQAELDAMALNDCTPSHAQSIRLKKLARRACWVTRRSTPCWRRQSPTSRSS